MAQFDDLEAGIIKPTSDDQKEQDSTDRLPLGSDGPSSACPQEEAPNGNDRTMNDSHRCRYFWCATESNSRPQFGWLYIVILLTGCALAMVMLFYGIRSLRSNVTKEFELDGK